MKTAGCWDRSEVRSWGVDKTTVIWPGTVVMEGAVIDADCTLGRDVHIGRRVRVGRGCKIQNGAQLFEGVELEDHVFVGPHAVFTNVSAPRAFVDRREGFKPTRVGLGASIGANATIRCGVSIGSFAMIGAGAVVTRDVLPYAVMKGVPAKRDGWACACGEPIAKHHGILRFERRECLRCCMVYEVSSASLVVAPREPVVHRTPECKKPPRWCDAVLRTADVTCALCSKPYSKHPYCAYSAPSENMRSSSRAEYAVHVTCNGMHVKL